MTGFTWAPSASRRGNTIYDKWRAATTASSGVELSRRLHLFLLRASAASLGAQPGMTDRLLEQNRGAPATMLSGATQAVDKLLATQPLKVPVSWFTVFGRRGQLRARFAVYKAIKPKDVNGTW